MINELLYADDLVILSEDMEDLKERFWEESHGQFSVVREMWKLGSWQMCKNKESYP